MGEQWALTSNDHPQAAAELPGTAVAPSQEVIGQLFHFCDLNSALEKSCLLFVSQSLFLRHESRFLIKTINTPTVERQKNFLPAGAVLRNSVENW